jgi:hypothetical protein
MQLNLGHFALKLQVVKSVLQISKMVGDFFIKDVRGNTGEIH